MELRVLFSAMRGLFHVFQNRPDRFRPFRAREAAGWIRLPCRHRGLRAGSARWFGWCPDCPVSLQTRLMETRAFPLDWIVTVPDGKAAWAAGAAGASSSGQRVPALCTAAAAGKNLPAAFVSSLRTAVRFSLSYCAKGKLPPGSNRSSVPHGEGIIPSRATCGCAPHMDGFPFPGPLKPKPLKTETPALDAGASGLSDFRNAG